MSESDSGAQISLTGEGFSNHLVRVTGAAVVETCTDPQGRSGDPDQNGRDHVDTEMLSMELNGRSPLLGQVNVRMSTRSVSAGQSEEVVNNNLGQLDVPPFQPVGLVDSFFDIFYEIRLFVSGEWQVLHSFVPVRLQSQLTHEPATHGEAYKPSVLGTPVDLLDQNGRPSGVSMIPHLTVLKSALLSVAPGSLEEGGVDVRWPMPSPNHVLQTSSNLNNPNGWTPVGGTVRSDGSNHTVNTSSESGVQLFCLLRTETRR